MRRSQLSRGFTLVELLVVIGIIALLISILLPSLNAARRQADAVKCSSALKQIANAFLFYAQDNKGYYPPTKAITSYTISYPAEDYTAAQYWPNFLAKYVTKTKVGENSNGGKNTVNDSAASRNSVFWGCPAWIPPATTSTLTGLGGTTVTQTGYGMNAFPEYRSDYPAIAAPPNTLGDSGFSPTLDAMAVATPSASANWATIYTTVAAGGTGRWYKQNAWTHPGERALVSDARFWLLEVQAAPLDGSMVGQGFVSIASTWAGATTTEQGDGQATYDFYRHGKTPPLASTGRFSATGGKVAFNVLYADGHVATLGDRAEGYRIARMRYPG